jgi:serine/threonine protein kinase
MHVARQIGRYHLLDRLACGGMAEIFRALTFDESGNEHMVAIKRILAHLAEDDAFVQMLVDEAKIASLLHHPNIAKVYEFARVADEYFLAMEYIDGRDLRSLIDRCRASGVQIAPEHCAHIMSCVLEGLHTAHTRCDAAGNALNIVHRDVSPSNVIVSYEGDVKLCDFGIAKATLSRVETRAGVVKGKVRYMSPEQTRGWQLDGRSDVFSAGSVLYELLTRRPAFSAKSEMELVLNVREAKYVRPSRHNGDIPRPLLMAIRRALTRSTHARYQTAADFGADLRRYLHTHAPDYDPTSLGRLLRHLFQQEIERDLRKLEDYVLGKPNPDALGDHLAGEPDPHHITYSRFTPVFKELAREDTRARTRIHPRLPTPESRLPPGVRLHEAETMIHQTDDSRRWVIKDRKQRQAERATDLPPPLEEPAEGSVSEGDDEVRAPKDEKTERDLVFHNATTQILSRKD